MCQRRTFLSVCTVAAGWFGMSGLTQIPKAHRFRHLRKKKKIPCIQLIHAYGELPDISAESLLTSFTLSGMLSPVSPYQPSDVHQVSPRGLYSLPAAAHIAVLPSLLQTPCCSLTSGWSSVFARPVGFQTPAFYPSKANLGFTPLAEKGIPRPCWYLYRRVP